MRRSAHVGQPEMDEEYSINRSKIFREFLKALGVSSNSHNYGMLLHAELHG